MTKQNKLIVGAVVVLGAYYLYDRNKKMKVVSDLKAGANVSTDTPVLPLGGGDRRTLETIKPMTSVPLVATKLRADLLQVEEGGNKFSNFAGKKGNSYFETIF